MEKDGPIAVLIILILVIGTFAFALAHDEEAEGENGDTPPTGGGITVQGSANAFAASGKSWVITAPALYANLNDGYTGNDPYILSVRSADDYAKGHIPGAHNIPWREVFKEENLATLPTNKQIVVYCYTGHTATQVTGALNTLGYDAVTLKWGIASWTTNTDIAGSYYDRASEMRKLPVVLGSEPGDWGSGTVSIYDDIGQGCGDDEPTNGGSTPPPTGGEDEDLGAAANAWFSSGKPAAVSAPSLFDRLNDTDASNDPFVLSIRSADQYAKGHIPGAVNMNWKTLFTEENLSKLPDDDTQVVVVCYTGHTASLVTAMLGMNGFNSTALKWGMTSWSENADVAPSFYVRGTDCHNYEVCDGTDAGSMATGYLAGRTDDEILLEATHGYLSAGTRFIMASDLADLLGDADETNDPFVLSIRGAADYETAHIPGAVNIAWRELFSLDNLALLPHDDTLIVVACYTGQSASHVTALLNVLGYNATTLAHGMCSWTPASSHCYDNTTAQGDYPVVEGGEPGTMAEAETRDNGCGGDGPTGGAAFEGSADEWEMMRQKVEAYVSTIGSLTITNKAVYNNLMDDYTANDPYIVSIRSADDYVKGHIPAAVQISAGELLTEENIAKLPTDQQIVVYCYTGQGAMHVTAMLNLLGYDAISLKFGMCSWTDNSTIAYKCFSEGGQGNFPIITGTEPGEWAAAAPAE